METLNDYLHKFTRLRTATSTTHWSAATRHKAPNKPLLLLTVLDLFAQGSVPTNLIELTPELAELYAQYWLRVMPPERRGNLAMPFFHMRSDGFWHLVAQPGQEPVLNALSTMTSMAQVRTVLLGAKLDDDLFNFMLGQHERDQLRAALIETYFATDMHAALVTQSATNVEAFRYAQNLIQTARTKSVKESLTNKIDTAKPVRDQGFRRAVVGAYDHRCAFCGIRMFTGDGHTVVEAAHIIPWAISYNDDPRNGLALCRLCHWAFDEGLMGVTGRYTVLTSRQLSQFPNLPGHLAPLTGRGIFLPTEDALAPDRDALAWHRRKRMAHDE